jgi:hypothetical protein
MSDFLNEFEDSSGDELFALSGKPKVKLDLVTVPQPKISTPEPNRLQVPEKPKVLLPHPATSQVDQHTETFPTTGLSWKDLHGD